MLIGQQKRNKTMNRLVLILGLLSLFPLSAKAQNMVRLTADSGEDCSVFVPIAKYLQRGDAECLAAWFADNLQVNVMGTNYTPRNFEIVYKSGTYPMEYAVGNLDSGGNIFTVTILVKTNDAGNYIEQLKIEKQ